ncbi:TRADD-N-associated membrane domain-containing protein [[Kitasatospora] papulosa]|uniref:TRADD-N-associated membrane domain-containing protein n=1 Tax=[Kitasatospora] papulosa TaxID=1464011 RepID=UPI00363E1CCC
MIFIVLGLLSVAAAGYSAVSGVKDLARDSTWATAAYALLGVATGATVALGVALWTQAAARRELAAVVESRKRLNRAEGALEQALRGGPEDSGRRTYELYERAGLVPEARSEPSEPPDPVSGQEAGGGRARQQAHLGLPELWETTHARLGLYHDIATGQARTSFRNAQVSMAVGFLLLVLFVVLALNASTTAGAIVAGGLGAVSAALSGFVSKTFIRSQEAAATHLRSYFDQPLELSRYLAAERLIADGALTQEQRGEVLSALVQAMVATPMQPQAPPSVVVTSVPQQGA